MADTTQGQRTAGETTRQAASQPARPTRASGRRRLACDSLYPTDAAAIARMKRGDTVPLEDCGWVQAIAPGAVDTGDIDPYVIASMERNGCLLPADADLDAAAPLATLRKTRAPIVTDTAAGEVDLG